MSTDLEDPDTRTADLLRHLVSPVTGVLKRVLLLPVGGGQIPYAHFTAAVPAYSTLPTGGDIANPGGSAWQRTRSLTQVTFEAIERYCAGFVEFGQLLLAPCQGEAFAAGSRHQRFAPHQYGQDGFPYVPLDPDAPIHWAVGRSVLSGQRRFVPASFVYLPYTPASPAEVIGPSFSTGMAAAWTLDDALLSGLLEVVERDAFTITWLNRLQRPKIRVPRSSTLGRRVAAVQADGVTSVEFVDITTDIAIPTVCAVMRRCAFGETVVTVGLACKLDYSSACDKALCEAISDHERLVAEMRAPSEIGTWFPKDDFSDVVDFPWHGRVYAHPRYQAHLQFLTAGEAVLDVDGEFRPGRAGDLVDVLQAVAPFASEVIAVDLTTREFVDLGIHVVKVMIPDLVPLNADHRFPYVGHRRFVTSGGAYPDRAASDAIAGANPYPHPFS
ncbi:MAG: hypothetical protein BGO26_20030 [Actinobacteria bacterium 69-20]|jgi:ribosomal protein S12 methylthiotransferase accessory factor|nr:YcaO-like family protein [Actinomycetota bacterium]OJV24806.1 MAG: hypothetical protein BGO26_20030 [Actinobacteria bacterium 69-20]